MYVVYGGILGKFSRVFIIKMILNFYNFRPGTNYCFSQLGYTLTMQVDKEYGVYLEVEEILDKREKYEFEELLKTAASTVMLRNQGNG
jgi:hypothetical protein